MEEATGVAAAVDEGDAGVCVCGGDCEGGDGDGDGDGCHMRRRKLPLLLPLFSRKRTIIYTCTISSLPSFLPSSHLSSPLLSSPVGRSFVFFCAQTHTQTREEQKKKTRDCFLAVAVSIWTEFCTETNNAIGSDT